MGKATISDLAQRAGVSTATVDRVLNGRAGVRAANRQRVLEAARELGYLPTEGMMPLPSRPAHLEFYIPFGRNAFMRSLAESVTNFAAALPLVASCRIVGLDGIGPDALERALEQSHPKTSGVGIITTDHPGTRDLIRKLSEAGVRVVTIASDIPGSLRSAYVGVDNAAAGRTAGLVMGRLIGKGECSLALFLGSSAFTGHREREMGFRAVIRDGFPHVQVLPPVETGEDSLRSMTAVQRLARSHGDLCGIYCVGAGRTGIVEALERGSWARRPVVIMHDLTAATRSWLLDDLIDVVIDQNARLVGEQSVLRLLGSIAAAAPFLRLRYIEPRIILRENVPP